jgi:hypothetical protein
MTLTKGENGTITVQLEEEEACVLAAYAIAGKVYFESIRKDCPPAGRADMKVHGKIVQRFHNYVLLLVKDGLTLREWGMKAAGKELPQA